MGNQMYHRLENFKNTMRPGDRFVLRNKDDRLGIKSDFSYQLIDFTVYRLYEHCVELHHKSRFSPKGFVLRYCPSYVTLFMYAAEEGFINPEDYDGESTLTINGAPTFVDVSDGQRCGAYNH